MVFPVVFLQFAPQPQEPVKPDTWAGEVRGLNTATELSVDETAPGFFAVVLFAEEPVEGSSGVAVSDHLNTLHMFAVVGKSETPAFPFFAGEFLGQRVGVEGLAPAVVDIGSGFGFLLVVLVRQGVLHEDRRVERGGSDVDS